MFKRAAVRQYRVLHKGKKKREDIGNEKTRRDFE